MIQIIDKSTPGVEIDPPGPHLWGPGTVSEVREGPGRAPGGGAKSVHFGHFSQNNKESPGVQIIEIGDLDNLDGL